MIPLRHLLAHSLLAVAAWAQPAAPARAFPVAERCTATTPCGRGRKILRVTTLAPDGPGSCLAALNLPGPPIIESEAQAPVIPR